VTQSKKLDFFGKPKTDGKTLSEDNAVLIAWNDGEADGQPINAKDLKEAQATCKSKA